jgi:hypothetical protein
MYAGMHNGNKLFTMRQDAPLRMQWNNGTGNWKLVLPNQCNGTVGTAGCSDGETYTNILAAIDPATDNAAPYKAAKYCADLAVNALGTTDPTDGAIHSDWYLPSHDELKTLNDNLIAPNVPGHNLKTTNSFPNSNFYWSSSEFNGLGAWVYMFASGNAGVNVKSGNLLVRCVRQ